jgi:hypothetical protein
MAPSDDILAKTQATFLSTTDQSLAPEQARACARQHRGVLHERQTNADASPSTTAKERTKPGKSSNDHE